MMAGFIPAIIDRPEFDEDFADEHDRLRLGRSPACTRSLGLWRAEVP
jgi:hypothetical protein